MKAETEFANVQNQYQSLTDQADELTKNLSRAREKRSAMRSRHDVLADMETKQQGLDKGVQNVIAA